MTVKAQVTLEFILVFVIMVFLLMGLLSLWKWSSDNIIRRQMNYNSTRIEAGKIAAGDEPPATYEAQPMTEKDLNLFK